MAQRTKKLRFLPPSKVRPALEQAKRRESIAHRCDVLPLPDWKTKVLTGWMLVNGSVCDDLLDFDDREYTIATKLEATPEVEKLVRFAFQRGAAAGFQLAAAN